MQSWTIDSTDNNEYICMYICIMYIYLCICICICICICTCMRMCMYMCMYVCMYVWIDLDIYTQYVYIYNQIYIDMGKRDAI